MEAGLEEGEEMVMSRMNMQERAALDRHITGNYGEDPFRHHDATHPEDLAEEMYEGAEARDKGVFLSANPYTAPGLAYQAWSRGWCDRDQTLISEGDDAD